MHSGWVITLSIAGAVAEIFGLFVGRFGYAGIRDRTVAFVRSCFPDWFRPRVISESVTVTVKVGAELQHRVIRTQEEEVGDRLARLELITDDLYRELDQRFTQVEQKVSDAFQRVQAEAAQHVQAATGKIDGEVKLDRRNLAHAAVWIVLGLLSSAAANIVGASG